MSPRRWVQPAAEGRTGTRVPVGGPDAHTGRPRWTAGTGSTADTPSAVMQQHGGEEAGTRMGRGRVGTECQEQIPTRERGTAHAPLARESRHQTKHTGTTSRGGGVGGQCPRATRRVTQHAYQLLDLVCQLGAAISTGQHHRVIALIVTSRDVQGGQGQQGSHLNQCRSEWWEQSTGSASDVRKTRRVHGCSVAHTAPGNHLLAE